VLCPSIIIDQRTREMRGYPENLHLNRPVDLFELGEDEWKISRQKASEDVSMNDYRKLIY
jgi:hypothetical protein